MHDQIKLRKKLLIFNYLFFVIIVIFNVLNYLISGKLDFVFLGVSLFILLLLLIPYSREFSVENFKLTLFIYGLGVFVFSVLLSFKSPIFIFLPILVSIYVTVLSIFKNTYKYTLPLLGLVFSFLLLFVYIGGSIDSKMFIQLKKSGFFDINYFYFVFLTFMVSIVSFWITVQVGDLIMSIYKSQALSIVQSKIDEVNRIASEKAKEVEQKSREILTVKEKQEKIFEINTNIAKRVKNIKAQLQYITSELKEMLYATGVVILLDKAGLISADYYADVPLPVVETLKVSPRSSDNIRKFISKAMKNKEVIHINKRKEIFHSGFSKEECISFLQEISKLTFEVYEVLMVPIVNSFAESMGLFVVFNNRYECFTDVDKRLAELIGIQAGILLHNSMLIKKLEDTFYETINAFSSAIEAKDKYTPVLHTYRVGELAYKVALEMGLSEEEAEKIKIAGILHDVGKLAIPDSILAKQGPLTEEEREIIKTHSEEGSKILSKISFFREKGIHIYVLYHHERVDGRGYPKGLRGREIPLAANIISVADTYDAISTPRPYNKQYASEQKAIEIIRAERGKQFFEEVVDAFLRVLEKEKMRKKAKS
ncbi:MAG: HD domain-containing protein [Candidatus Calescibacterium sp.]|nr:HD domain-containing protein [Candidatus Calescibacterium sp.]MCX7972283.1 HD domain-containing protein [bacterium]MDW8195114.1 HD domain-containing protein [Candidatus Calescibacterium sp.]